MPLTATELRLAWVVLAVLCFTTPPPGSLAVATLLLVVLAPGALLLASRTWADRAAKELSEAMRTRAPRVALILAAGLIIVTAFLFSVSGALLLTALLGAGVMLAALRGGPARVHGLLGGIILTGLAMLIGGGALEFLLGHVYAARLGAPSELMAWNTRYDGIWRSNLFNMRSPYERLARRPGVLRVLAFGDSFTWGDKIARTEDTWPAALERRLTHRLGRPVEVVNTGQKGWSTANEAELLRRFGWQWQPDLIIVQYTLNDAAVSGPNFETTQDRDVSLLPPRLSEGAIRHSALLFLLERRAEAWLARPEGYTPRYDTAGVAWTQLAAALREIGDSAAQRRVPALLLLYPTPARGVWTAETYPWRELVDRVARTGRTAGLDVVDLIPVLAAQGGNWARWWAMPYDPHPNPAADSLAADVLAARIVERGYLDRTAIAQAPDTAPAVRARRAARH
ncbi:MAG TPA: SGNH/GDSL hydrolase family protein [Gemmatimonadales bacterium]|nr:SGNH/GDSL hydrolase family protein [Gemmatimonadales bacterium]